MIKKIIARAALGLPIGISIGCIITLVLSLLISDGYYHPCVPEFIAVMENELNAVILQTVLCGLLGAGFSASSVIWSIEHWSIAKQTGIYFAVISLIMLPIAYLTYWMEHSLIGFISYFGIFILIFAFIWIVEFIIIKHNIKKMNENLHNSKENADTENR